MYPLRRVSHWGRGRLLDDELVMIITIYLSSQMVAAWPLLVRDQDTLRLRNRSCTFQSLQMARSRSTKTVRMSLTPRCIYETGK